MNWGYKIMTVIIVFIVGMLTMVFVAFKQTNEMMDENYYQRELQYQTLIDASENLSVISKNPLLQMNGENLELTLPAGARNTFEKGEIEFVCVNDQSKDITLPIQIGQDGVQKIEKALLGKGNYTVRIKWKNDGKQFYRQEKLIISK
jgi:hypothetical protein